ncbi:uncharacterized protein METZ01_LOCUS50177 [marine metagenome]|uniref:Uncharacterized protein n=1 Tax=marine metagenome TaxID=408172 RepID=A0A381S8A5_9ZZZZ
MIDAVLVAVCISRLKPKYVQGQL